MTSRGDTAPPDRRCAYCWRPLGAAHRGRYCSERCASGDPDACRTGEPAAEQLALPVAEQLALI